MEEPVLEPALEGELGSLELAKAIHLTILQLALVGLGGTVAQIEFAIASHLALGPLALVLGLASLKEHLANAFLLPVQDLAEELASLLADHLTDGVHDSTVPLALEDVAVRVNQFSLSMLLLNAVDLSLVDGSVLLIDDLVRETLEGEQLEAVEPIDIVVGVEGDSRTDVMRKFEVPIEGLDLFIGIE
jgi:hypothetical protein